MTWLTKRRTLKHLGTLHGTGNLVIENGEQNLGIVTYEIDGYRDQTQRSANGQIEGGADILAQAFAAGGACIAVTGGEPFDIVLADPLGGPTAEVTVNGRFPRFAHDLETVS